jgi:hypothetical protein
MSATSSRARPYAFALAVLFLVSASATPAQAAESRGGASQDGWWNRLQGPQEGEPGGNPLRPLFPALPKPPNVPADAIATGATAGQVDKVAAVGIDIVLAEGATLDRLVLRLKESDASGANMGADKAKVLACPATAPWGPGQNANWQDRAVADCELGAAEGVRAEDGTWSFDLAALGRLWSDPYAAIPAYGVVLAVDPAGSPASVQVSWLNLDTGSVGVELAATPPVGGIADNTPPASGPGVVAPATAAEPSVDSIPGTGLSSPGTEVSRSPDSSYGPTAGVPTTGPGVSAGEAAPESPGASLNAAPELPPPPALQARPPVGFWGRVPAATTLLLPVALGLALLVSLTLGPAGRPSPVFRREGGLSRALARRNAGSVDAA